MVSHGILVTNHLFHKDLTHAVDLEVIKMKTQVPSETTGTREDFRTRLLARDHCCVWTGAERRFADASHIIPYKRGSEVCSSILCKEGI